MIKLPRKKGQWKTGTVHIRVYKETRNKLNDLASEWGMFQHEVIDSLVALAEEGVICPQDAYIPWRDLAYKLYGALKDEVDYHHKENCAEATLDVLAEFEAIMKDQ